MCARKEMNMEVKDFIHQEYKIGKFCREIDGLTWFITFNHLILYFETKGFVKKEVENGRLKELFSRGCRVIFSKMNENQKITG